MPRIPLVKTLLLSILIALMGGGYAAAADETLAIIVNRNNPVDDISSGELSRIFRLEQQYWGNGEKIYAIMLETGTIEKSIMLQKIYKMDEDSLKRFWLGKLYRAEVAAFPKTFASSEAVKRYVRQVPNAIGYVSVSTADETVKIIRIDGKLPQEAGYALTAAKPRAEHWASNPVLAARRSQPRASALPALTGS